MKTLRNEIDATKARELFNIIEKRKAAEKKEKALKEYFKSKCEGDQVIKIGAHIITLTDKERSSLDKKQLIADHGEEFVNDYEYITTYTVLDIKRVA